MNYAKRVVFGFAISIILVVIIADKASVEKEHGPAKPNETFPPLPPMPEKLEQGPVLECEFILISAGGPIKIDGESVTKLPYEFTGTNIQHPLHGKLWGSSNFTHNGTILKGL